VPTFFFVPSINVKNRSPRLRGKGSDPDFYRGLDALGENTPAPRDETKQSSSLFFGVVDQCEESITTLAW
jgi:hypothetical protein